MSTLHEIHVALREKYGPDPLILSIANSALDRRFKAQLTKVEESIVLQDHVISTSRPDVTVSAKPEADWQYKPIGSNARFSVSGNLVLSFLATTVAGPQLIRHRTVAVRDLELTIVGDQRTASGISIVPSELYANSVTLYPSGADTVDETILNEIGISRHDYLVVEEAFALVSAPNITRTIAALFDLPPFRQLLVAVDFKGPLVASCLADRLVITGQTNPMLSSCAYRGSGTKLFQVSNPSDEELAEVCGNYLGELIGDIVVSYPKNVFQTVLDFRALARPTVRDWGDRVDTVHYVQWDASISLTSAKIAFDVANVKISIDTRFEASGSGQAGLCVFGCDATRTRLASLTVDPSAELNSQLSAEPCIDESNVFLRVMWTTDSSVEVKFQVDGAISPVKTLLEWLISDHLTHKLSDEIKNKACQNLEIPLISLNGLQQTPNMKQYSDMQPIVRKVSRDLLQDSILLNLGFSGGSF